MNKRIKIDFPDEFFEKLSKALKKEKSWRDWLPMIISGGTLILLFIVYIVTPRVKETDFDIRINREMVLTKTPNIEVLDIPVSVHNYGKTVLLDKHPDIIFTGKGDTKFLIQGVFQGNINPEIRENSIKNLRIDVSNKSFIKYQNVKSFRELLGKTKIEIRAKVRGRIIPSKPVDFKEPNVNIIFNDKGNDRGKQSETLKH